MNERPPTTASGQRPPRAASSLTGRDIGSIEIADGLSVGWFPLSAAVVGVLVIAGLGQFLARTRTGRAMRATSDDQEAAQLMGIDNRRLYAVATAMALGTVAVAGVFLGARGTFDPGSGARGSALRTGRLVRGAC